MGTTMPELVFLVFAGILLCVTSEELDYSKGRYRRRMNLGIDGCICRPRLECPDPSLWCGQSGKVCCSVETTSLPNPSNSAEYVSYTPKYRKPSPSIPRSTEITPTTDSKRGKTQPLSFHDITGKGTPRPIEKRRCGIGIARANRQAASTTAEENEFPWTVGIFVNGSPPTLICGAVLTNLGVAVTAAHCVQRYKDNPNLLVVTAGDWVIEWETGREKERIKPSKRLIEKIILHEKYDPLGLHNDIAVLILKTPFNSSASINTICLPTENTAIIPDQCYISGWGSSSSDVEATKDKIMKKVHATLLDPNACEEKIRSTDNGPEFVLSDSAMCGQETKGSTGWNDGGTPFFCKSDSKKKPFYLVGITSWGKAKFKDAPTVFASVYELKSWIDKASFRH